MSTSGPAAGSSPATRFAPVDLVILVALREEFRALFSFIREALTVERDGQLSDPIYRFQRPGPAQEPPYQCAAMLIGSMGPTQAGLAAQGALQRLNPATLVLLGIAAGIDKDALLGDVIAADVVDGYLENAKAVGDGDGRFRLTTAGEPFRTSDAILKAIQNFEFEHEALYRAWREEAKVELADEARHDLAARGFLGAAPSLLTGHIASGPVVGAAAEFTSWLKSRDRKYLALEMEAAGFLAAVHQRQSPTSTLVLRGISDFGDERKQSLDATGNGAFRRYAMQNALRLLWGLLSAGKLPRHQQPSPPPGFPGPEALPITPAPPAAAIGAPRQAGSPTVHAPQARSRFFVGRAKTLATMREKLNGARECPAVALTGMGGIGKTQLALEFVYRYALDEQLYPIALWVRADSKLTLQRELAALAGPLSLNIGTDEEARWQAVRRCLSLRSDWLLILDNVPSPEALEWIRPLLPERFGGHVILTSRFPHWSEFAEEMPVPLLPRQESVALLRKRAGHPGGSEPDARADALAEALGDLPLALTQAAAYVKAAGKTFAEYLDLFRREQARLLAQPRPADYPETVATTWSLSMERTRSEQPAAADLLNLCAYLAPVPIVTSALRAGASLLPPLLAGLGASEVSWDKAISTLNDLSLITAERDTIWVHQLVQAVTRLRLSADDQHLWANSALKWTTALYKFEDTDAKTWWQSALIFPHLWEAIRRGVEQDARPEALPYAILSASRALENNADLRPANELLAYADSCNLTDHGEIFFQVQLMRARVLLKEGKSQAARDLLEKLRPEISKIKDLDARAAAESVVLNDLSIYSTTLGDYKTALDYANASLKALEGGISIAPLHAATSLGALAVAHSALDQFVPALDAHQRALAIYDQHAPPPHPRYAAMLCNMGDILMRLGRLKESRECLLKALAMSQGILGPWHPQCAGILRNLYKVSNHLGLYEEAFGAATAALQIDEKVLPAAHPSLADDYSNVGQLYIDRRRLDEAYRHLKRALHIAEQAYGKNNPNTAIFRAQYGRALEAKQLLPAARVQLEQARSDLEAAALESSTDMAVVLMNLATVYGGLREWKLALESAERGLAIDERLHGPEHPEVANDLLCLGTLLMGKDDYQAADPILRRCIEIRQRQLGPDNPETKQTRSILAGCLAQQDKHAEAAAVLHALIKSANREPDVDPRKVLTELVSLHERRAYSLQAIGQFKTAAGELTAALQELIRKGQRDSPKFQELTKRLAMLRNRQRASSSGSPKPAPKSGSPKKPKRK